MTGAMEGSPFIGHTCHSVVFSQDGKWIASGSNDCAIRVWNAVTGSMEGSPFTGHTNFVNSLAFSHDGQRIVSGSFDHTICVCHDRSTRGKPVNRAIPIQFVLSHFFFFFRKMGNGLPLAEMIAQFVCRMPQRERCKTIRLLATSAQLNSVGFSHDG